jgi:TPR repeat protein
LAILFVEKRPHDRRALRKDKEDFAQVRHEQRKQDRYDMKASRVITLLLVVSVAVVQLAGQQTKADQKPIGEVKAKAEAGDADSQVELGLRYELGKGVAKDQGEAVKWYRKAAEQNYARAQYDLGLCYLDGKGVPKNQVEAVKWFRKAAEQNDAAAQYNLGVCFYNGDGVAKDQAEAVKWYRKAAEQNFAEAQYNLGICFYNGDGVAKDWVEAYKWLLLAARQGDKDAKKNLTALERKLTPEQIAEGQKRARDFKPR